MKLAVTGVGGFVGSKLSTTLCAAGHTVIGIARGDYPHLAQRGIVVEKLDLAKVEIDTLVRALDGCEAVFHVAAKVGMSGPASEFKAINVGGTEKMLIAAQRAGVKRFIYTSSPSVVANGKDLCKVDETTPYPKHYEAWYPRTKAEAEQKVLAANSEKFRTVALRPHLIFGPGDTNLIPTIIKKAKAGRLAIIGEGKNLCDFSFIDDCVSAHINAERALEEDFSAAGRAYFISQGEPMNLWEFIARILSSAGLPPLTKHVSYKVAYSIASIAELVAKVIPGFEPPLSKFLVSEMATSHYFDISAAREKLRYVPIYSMNEALATTLGGKFS